MNLWSDCSEADLGEAGKWKSCYVCTGLHNYLAVCRHLDNLHQPLPNYLLAIGINTWWSLSRTGDKDEGAVTGTGTLIQIIKVN